MAERNQQKIADNHGIADDDPFAELTRIMGFDPREPARPQAVEPRFTEASADVHDDFDIDLEKELMGEFSVEEEPVQAASEGGYEPASGALDEPAPQVGETDAAFEETAVFEETGAFEDRGAFEDMDDAVAASLEQDFALDDEVAAEASIDAAEPVADPLEQFARSYAARGKTPERTDTTEMVADPVQEPWFEPVADDAGDNEFSAADETETLATATAAEDDSDFDAAVSADLDDAFAPAEEPAALYEEPARHDEPAPLKEPETYQAAADDEAEAFEEADSCQPFDHGQPEAAAYQPATHDPAVSDDFEASFDSAMADVDMDFADSPQPEPVAFDASEVGEAVDEDVSNADSDIDSTFDKAFATETYAEPTALEPSEPAVAAPRENTLEDELNALLNKMTARSTVPAASSAWSLATPVARQEQSPAAPQIAQTAQPAVDEATADEPAMDEDDLEATLVADLHAMEFDDEAHTAGDVDFDTEAFHAALTEADDDEAASAADPVEALNWPTPAPSTMQAAAPVMPNADRGAPARPEAPEVETVDVPERVAAVADDLDIPDVPFEEPGEGNALFDDLENEFAGLLGQMNATPAQTHAAYDDGFRRGSTQAEAAPAAFGQQAAYSSPASFHPASAGMDGGGLAGGAPFAPNDPFAPTDPFAAGDPAYDPDEAVAVSDMGEIDDERRPRRGLLVAGIVCAVAVIGGLGALAMSFGGDGASDAPALVKADNAPVKVKPKNPGGTVIPNQDNKVYEAVAKGIQPASPTQQKLVTSNDDPVDVAAAAPLSRVVDLSRSGDTDAQDAAPFAKSEDRVEQPTRNADAAAPDAPIVTPHKVRTLVVKPDGSLVPREDPAPVVAATEPADPAPQHVISDDQTGAVPSSQSGESALKPANTAGEAASTPSTAPIAPQRPSDQPVDVVGEVKPDQVASVDTTAPAGAWSMQIASQPTAESAQSTYKDLSRRYDGILGGRGVNIVKADIAGKGTFYRVRVPTQTRNEAINLCESYKAAGGNCFVSK